MTRDQWIALASFLTMLLTGLLSILRHPPFVPISQLEALKQRVAEMAEEIKELKSALAEQRTINSGLRDQIEWLNRKLWQYDNPKGGTPGGQFTGD